MARETLGAGELGGDLDGSGRYRIEGLLGSGAFGEVYRAFDSERGVSVALKVLRRTDPAALYRFKREFRSLADVAHPNLVALHELAAEGDRLFFTMELVHGVDFLSWACPESDGDPQESFDSDSFDRTLRERRFERLRDALGQLAEGLNALHAAGHLHRDLKPANVLVTPEGRVLLLDFGLVADVTPGELVTTLDVVGSPAYMAPEQAAEAPVGTPSDWYSVGVMLFEALTGQLPFEGRPLHVMVQKQTTDAPPVRSLAAGIPADLGALCDELLRRDPGSRPTGDDLLRRLRGGERPSTTHPPSVRPPVAPFVGRARELATLHEALLDTRIGRSVAVQVHAASGMGKTSLLRRFAHELTGHGAVVLRGRCFEQESVAFKGLDSVVDDLSRYLRSLPDEQVRGLLPRDVAALVRLFPVLEQVKPLADVAHQGHIVPDPAQLRRGAFGAFRELLGRMSTACAVVLMIDDAQWGDADSASLLLEVLRAPAPPPILVVVGYREDETTRSPFLSRLLPIPSPAGVPLSVLDMPLGELGRDEAVELAEALMDSPDRERAESIAAEAHGSPFFVAELVRHQSEADAPRVDLETALRSRIGRLSADAQRLLGVLAVAAQPVDRSVCSSAADIEGDEMRVVAELRAGNLVRSRRAASGRSSLESFHDRIRAAVAATLSADEQRAVHRRLFAAHREAGDTDAETLARHLVGAGEPGAAARHRLEAAHTAFHALAWDRAARLYRGALELDPALDDDGSVLVRLGDALANAGRGAEAAEAYGQASERTGAADRVDLRRRAAEQLLRSGRVEEGYAAADAVLREVGLSIRSLERTVVSLIASRARLWIRGLRFQEKAPEDLPSEVLRRIDVAWSIGVGFGMMDSIRGAELLARSLLAALAAGEPHRVARSLAFEAAFTSNGGAPKAERAAELVQRTEALAERLADPHLRGLAAGCACVAAFHAGRFDVSIRQGERAERIFREECTGVVKEIVSVQLFQLGALAMVGNLTDLVERVPRYLRAAEERGDYYATTNLRSGFPNLVWLALDDPTEARREADRAMAGWSRKRFLLQHFFDLYAQSQIDLYEGDGARGRDRVRSARRDLERSYLLRLEPVRVLAAELEARTAIAASSQGAHPDGALAEAEAMARRIERERARWARPLADACRAQVALCRGDAGEADVRFSDAAAGFDTAHMSAHAAASRLARARIGGRGAQADAQLETLASLGARAPERYARMILPALPRS